MPVQIVADDEVIFEFDSELELQTLANIIAHAKFGKGMRWEYTFSETAFELIQAIRKYSKKRYANDPLWARYFVDGAEPSVLEDDGALQKLVVEGLKEMLEEQGQPIDENSDQWKELLAKGMYPWSIK